MVVVEINKGGVVKEVTTPNDPNSLPTIRLRPATQDDFIKYGMILQRMRDGRQQYVQGLGTLSTKNRPERSAHTGLAPLGETTSLHQSNQHSGCD